MHHQHHGSLTLDERQDVGEDPVDHGVQGALLLEDDPGQVEQHLVPLHLQQRPLIDLSIPQTQATELEILLKHLTVVITEVAVIVLVDHLGHANHSPCLVLDGGTHHGLGLVAGHVINV